MCWRRRDAPHEAAVGCSTYALNSAKLGGLTAAGFIQNTTTVQTATNMAIDGTARTLATSILTPLVDTNSAVALNIGTTNATSINLNQNVTVAANKVSDAHWRFDRFPPRLTDRGDDVV